MRIININIKENQKQYPIFIGKNLIEKLSSVVDVNKYSTIVIITDENISKHWLKTLMQTLPTKSPVIILPAGEQHKNIDTVQAIWKQLHKFGCDRKTLVVNLGGGVITDMGAFAASTFLRGVDFIQVPTSLLAQAEASVGGKTGINFNEIKNYIGFFAQPITVIIDAQTLTTLPRREYHEGFGEIIKHGLISDKQYFEFSTSKRIDDFSIDEIIKMITKSNIIRSKFAEVDEKEHGSRKLLNFGHTIGHAVEAVSWETNKPLLHGEAVCIGMVAETRISNLVGLLSRREAEIVEHKLQKTGLPASIKGVNIDQVMNKINYDKKNIKGQVNWTLLKHIGEAVYDQKVDDVIVRQALKGVIVRAE